jgi:hypothetical protein
MKARFAVLLGAGLLLGGCFDAHYDIALNNDGSGSIVMDVLLDKDVSRDILQKNGKPDFKTEKKGGLGKNAVERRRVENGRIVISQSLAFKTMTEISASDVDLEVRDLGRTLYGMERTLIRFGAGDNGGRRNTDKHDPFAAGFAAQIFKGHEMRVSMHLPCTVESANTLSYEDASYVPKVEKSWFHGSSVEWKLPMVAMMAMSEAGGTSFTVTCKSFRGIKPGRSNGPGK